LPAVSNQAGFGRRDFFEIRDAWDAVNTIRVVIENSPVAKL